MARQIIRNEKLEASVAFRKSWLNPLDVSVSKWSITPTNQSDRATKTDNLVGGDSMSHLLYWVFSPNFKYSVLPFVGPRCVQATDHTLIYWIIFFTKYHKPNFMSFVATAKYNIDYVIVCSTRTERTVQIDLHSSRSSDPPSPRWLYGLTQVTSFNPVVSSNLFQHYHVRYKIATLRPHHSHLHSNQPVTKFLILLQLRPCARVQEDNKLTLYANSSRCHPDNLNLSLPS